MYISFLSRYTLFSQPSPPLLLSRTPMNPLSDSRPLHPYLSNQTHCHMPLPPFNIFSLTSWSIWSVVCCFSSHLIRCFLSGSFGGSLSSYEPLDLGLLRVQSWVLFSLYLPRLVILSCPGFNNTHAEDARICNSTLDLSFGSQTQVYTTPYLTRLPG